MLNLNFCKTKCQYLNKSEEDYHCHCMKIFGLDYVVDVIHDKDDLLPVMCPYELEHLMSNQKDFQ